MSILVGPAASPSTHPHLQSYGDILSGAKEVDDNWDFRMITDDGETSPVLCRISNDPDNPSIYIHFIAGSDGLERYNGAQDGEEYKFEDPTDLPSGEWFPYAIVYSDSVPLSQVGGCSIEVRFDDPSMDNFFTWDGPIDQGVTTSNMADLGYVVTASSDGKGEAFSIGRAHDLSDAEFSHKVVEGIKEVSRRWNRFVSAS